MIALSGLEQKGCVHLYVGDGKGKTTAAAGLAARFLGGDLGGVLFCQFLKGRPSGEVESLRRLGAEVRRPKSGGKFYSAMDEGERAALRASHAACLDDAAEAAREGGVGLLVLDEVVDAVNLGVIPEGALLSLLANRHPSVEIVLTGRNPSPAIIDAADYHTEFACRCHPYQKGLAARAGIEY
jgi:cob(I)alamin adenosyltransferase